MQNISQKLASTILLAIAFQLHGQGYIYDQQSATSPLYSNYDNLIISSAMWMQSFEPTLSSVDFVQLELTDILDSGTSGATFSVALWSGSLQNPTFIADTESASLAANYHNDGLAYSAIITFDFATSVDLTPGENYLLEVIEITGGSSWSVAVTDDTYQSGQLYDNGTPLTPSTDLWFREGVVPEPSDLALLALGGLLICGILGFKGRIEQLKTKHKKLEYSACSWIGDRIGKAYIAINRCTSAAKRKNRANLEMANLSNDLPLKNVCQRGCGFPLMLDPI